MSEYKENPKTKGSGIVCCIPQRGRCPNNCPDCFFQSGRSYLEPLKANLPNMPDPVWVGDRIVRVNDGNDSSHQQDLVMLSTAGYPLKFYNTSRIEGLADFDAPVVLTINPGRMTDTDFYVVSDPDVLKRIMFVRFRTNTWNWRLRGKAVKYYSDLQVPIVLTFMAYHSEESIPEDHRWCYSYRQRTLNPYWAIIGREWDNIMSMYCLNPWVYSCGKIEGEGGTTKCRHCGNCHREFFVAMERMRTERATS